MKHKVLQQITCLFFSLFQTGLHSAQDKTVENRTININNQGTFQIDFTSPISTHTFTSPANSPEYYTVKLYSDNKSIQLQTSNTSLPPSILKVEETNGKVWVINILYKADIDLENESVFDFSENSIIRGKNILMRLTEEKNILPKQNDPIPFSTEELGQLNKTYPGIDFSVPPPSQTFNLLETGKTDQTFIEDLYNNKKSGLKLEFRHEMTSIGIICQDIGFNGNNAYLKLLLKNAGENEVFLTGNMLLRLVRQNGQSLNLYPSQIYPSRFPIIKAKSQIPVIYVFKAYDVATEDTLRFEISDRLQKINLEFSIPGPVFNESKKD